LEAEEATTPLAAGQRENTKKRRMKHWKNGRIKYWNIGMVEY
jgi:hypothetical protein